MNQSKLLNFLIQNVSTLNGVGTKTKKLLKKKKIEKICDLLWNLPQSFTDRSNVQTLDKLEIGKITTIKVKVIKYNFPRIRNLININEVSPEDLFKTKCDIISPCALGGAINNSSKYQLQCKVIVGAANNQLDDSSIGGWLKKKNIVYSPDYLVNSGGVIAIASEINNAQNLLTKQLEKIGDRLLPVLEESKKSGESTDLVARRIAWERINS